MHEAEYVYLQQAVWEYTDKFRAKTSLPKGSGSGSAFANTEDEEGGNVTTTDSYTCNNLIYTYIPLLLPP